jgi:tRNA(fMet)-specific endonuclease VapC
VIWLLDTDTFVFMVRGFKIASAKNEHQRQRAETAHHIATQCRARRQAGDLVGLSAITIAELEYGARLSDDYEAEIAAVHRVLTPFVCYDFDARSCGVQYGQIRRDLETAGTTIGAMDLLIAAHAKALGATLITNNRRHFARVSGLNVENWSS